MRLFLLQLRGEFHKLCARRRTWIAFGAAVAWEVIVSILLKFPPIRLRIQRDIWKMKWQFEDVFSGLTTAAHMLGEVATLFAALSCAFVAADLIAQEADDGTLRTIFCRPISRTLLLVQKLIVGIAYVAVLVAFMGATALAVGLMFEGPGRLVMVAIHEGVLGAFDFAEGLRRYGLATVLLAASSLTGFLVSMACSCLRVKPAAAIALALTVFLADQSLRTAPGFVHVSPYCITTRMLSWRQVFNEDIPWLKLQRNYRQLALIDAGAVLVAWLLFRRREFNR